VRDYFETLTKHLESRLKGQEVFTATFHSECSDFVRFNRGLVRQAGDVQQHELAVDWIRGRRQAGAHVTLAGELATDTARLDHLISGLRDTLDQIPDDPHLLYATDPSSSERAQHATLPIGGDACDAIVEAAGGRDLVGLYAAGGMAAGFANSLGQRNWHESASFHLDWSFHHNADKAVKGSYAGTDWQHDALRERFERGAEQLEVLARPSRRIEPGRYRVYLTPAALLDIIEMLGFGGFGLRAHRTRTTPLLRLAQGEARLDPAVFLCENSAEGIAPDFQRQGFRRPDQVSLVSAGRYQDCLVSPRSAAEFGVETNGADGSESPQSIDLAGGTLAESSVLDELGTGVYVANLWYLNYSDRKACRTTGMTRFATFWVEQGRISAPLDVMRFDESVYRILGENLLGLTAEREMLLDPDTYGRRSSRSFRLPGALIDEFSFTL
jgi:predicted Zn-dependent protease